MTRIFVLVMVIAALAGIANADTVNVTPGNMNGWVIATQQGTAGSPPVAVFNDGPLAAPAGYGSFRMRNNYSDTDPLSKIFLGTNNLNGVRLSRITSFKYYTYVASRAYGESGDPNGQPPVIEIMTGATAIDPATGEPYHPQMRQWVYKPWGQYGNSNVLIGGWQEWDLMASNGRWELLAVGDPSDISGNWQWLLNRYLGREHAFRQPLEGDGPYGQYYQTDYGIWPKSESYKFANLSGTSLSIRIGSPKALDNIRGSWWRESCAINAYVDKLVIGIDGVETVYDFDPTAKPVVGIVNKAATQAVTQSGRVNFRFVACGSVIWDDPDTLNKFSIDDGSGYPIKVYAAGHTLSWGSPAFVRVKGRLDTTTVPATLYSTAADVTPL